MLDGWKCMPLIKQLNVKRRRSDCGVIIRRFNIWHLTDCVFATWETLFRTILRILDFLNITFMSETRNACVLCLCFPPLLWLY